MSNGILHYHNEYRAKAPGVVTGRSGTIGRLHFIASDYWPHNTALWVTDFMGNFPKFVYHLYDKEDLSRFGTGTGVPTLNRNDVHNHNTHIPCVCEQKKISHFMDTIDNIITINQRKHDGLKKLKAAYLQQMFPQAGERVPRVRFEGFTGEWTTRELGAISVKVSQKNKNNEYSETLTNSAEHGIISQRDFFDKDISNQKNLDGYFVVYPDDFVYNPRISNYAPVGPVKRNLLGRAGVMSPLYYVFRMVDGNLNFVEKYFESIYWHEFMKLNGDNGVRADRFNIKDSIFETMPIPFPTLEEQAIIGIFFRNLDTQITIQAQKTEQLKQLKTAYLQKMFI